ncbi:CbtB domain-containing protein, partial [Pseudomonas sp. SDO5211_S404]
MSIISSTASNTDKIASTATLSQRLIAAFFASILG